MRASRQISGSGKLLLLVLLVGGLAGSIGLGSSLEQKATSNWEEQAEQTAQRLTSTFILLLNASNSPLRSLATLFNGSGRVSAKEFADTIVYMQRQSSMRPPAFAYMVRSNSPDCAADAECWIVAYSTSEQGLLKPGAELSRFAPTATTIAAAMEYPDAPIIGPVFRQASGQNASLYAVKIENTRQFGVLVSLIDYAAIVADLNGQWVIEGMALRLEGSFPAGTEMTDYQYIHGDATPLPETVRSITIPYSASHAEFRFAWDMLPGFRGGPDTKIATAVLVAGSVITVLVTLVAGLLLMRIGQRSD